jgi:hypothetical protein
MARQVDINWLKTINPRCKEYPDGFDGLEARGRAERLYKSIRERFPSASFDVPQDATYHAGISIGVPMCQVRLSNFERLACITCEERLDESMRGELVSLIEAAGYIYVPFEVLGVGFLERQIGSGDLITQLFDYT